MTDGALRQYLDALRHGVSGRLLPGILEVLRHGVRQTTPCVPTTAAITPRSRSPAGDARSCLQACARCALRFAGVRSAVYAVPPPDTAALCAAVADACSQARSQAQEGAAQPATSPAQQEFRSNGSSVLPGIAAAALNDGSSGTGSNPTKAGCARRIS